MGAGRDGSTRPRCRKRVRPGAVCDRSRWDGPEPAAESRGRKGCSFPRSLGGQADGEASAHIHPSIHPLVSCNSCSLGRGSLGDFCSCWHTNRRSLQRRIPSMVTVQLGSSFLVCQNLPAQLWHLPCLFLLPFSSGRRKWHCPAPQRPSGAVCRLHGSPEPPAVRLHPAHIHGCPSEPGQESC